MYFGFWSHPPVFIGDSHFWLVVLCRQMDRGVTLSSGFESFPGSQVLFLNKFLP